MRDRRKNNTLLGGRSAKRKRKDFFHGEVFFLLTQPLMGDPFGFQIINCLKVLVTCPDFLLNDPRFIIRLVLHNSFVRHPREIYGRIFSIENQF